MEDFAPRATDMLCAAGRKSKKSWLDSDEIITISSDSEDQDQEHSLPDRQKSVSNNLKKDVKVQMGAKQRSPAQPVSSPTKKSKSSVMHSNTGASAANKQSKSAISHNSLQSSVKRTAYDNQNQKKDSSNQTKSTVQSSAKTIHKNDSSNETKSTLNFPAKAKTNSALPRKKNKKLVPKMKISKSLFTRDSTPTPVVNDLTNPDIVLKSDDSDSRTSTTNSQNNNITKLKGTGPVIVLSDVKSRLSTEHLRQLHQYGQSLFGKKDEAESNPVENQCSSSKTNAHATFEALKPPANAELLHPKSSKTNSTHLSHMDSNACNSETVSQIKLVSNEKSNKSATFESGAEKRYTNLNSPVSPENKSELVKLQAKATTSTTSTNEDITEESATNEAHTPAHEVTGHGTVGCKVRKRPKCGKKTQAKFDDNGYTSILSVQSDVASNGLTENSSILTSQRSVSVALFNNCREQYRQAVTAERVEQRAPFVGVKIKKRTTMTHSIDTDDSGEKSQGATVCAETSISSSLNKAPAKRPSKVSLTVDLGAKYVGTTISKQRAEETSPDDGIELRVPLMKLKMTSSESSTDINVLNTDSDEKVSSNKRRKILPSVPGIWKKIISDDDVRPKRQGKARKRTRSAKRTRTSAITRSRAPKRKHESSVDQSSGTETLARPTSIRLRKRKPVQYSEFGPPASDATTADEKQVAKCVRDKKYRHIVLKEMNGLSEIVLTVEATEHKPPEPIFFRQFNYLFTRTLKELIDAFQICRANDKCKLVVLSSVGPVFCSGLDPRTLLNWTPGLSRHQDIVKLMRKLVSTLIMFQKTIVAVVQGPAVGFGATLLLHCDSVYTSDRAEIQWPFVQIGLPPFGCTSESMTVSVGACKARSLLLEGGVITAKTAKEIGIVTELFPHDSLMTNAMARCVAICQSPAYALLQTKLLLKNDSIKRLSECNYCESVQLKQCLQYPSCRERLQQYVIRQSQLS